MRLDAANRTTVSAGTSGEGNRLVASANVGSAIATHESAIAPTSFRIIHNGGSGMLGAHEPAVPRLPELRTERTGIEDGLDRCGAREEIRSAERGRAQVTRLVSRSGGPEGLDRRREMRVRPRWNGGSLFQAPYPLARRHGSSGKEIPEAVGGRTHNPAGCSDLRSWMRTSGRAPPAVRERLCGARKAASVRWDPRF